MIQLKDALREMETNRDRGNRPVPFQLQFVTCNEGENTGGEVITLEGVVLAKLAADRKPSSQALTRSCATSAPRKANEWANSTRNFYILESKQVRKVHIRLITQFNHETVVY